MKIPFSPPDIGDLEVAEVVDTLRSGWITTGPKTKRFEAEVASGAILPGQCASIPPLRRRNVPCVCWGSDPGMR